MCLWSSGSGEEGEGWGAPPALSGDADSRRAKGLELLPRPLVGSPQPCVWERHDAGTQERSFRSPFEEKEGEEEENDQKKEEKERKKKRSGEKKRSKGRRGKKWGIWIKKRALCYKQWETGREHWKGVSGGERNGKSPRE